MNSAIMFKKFVAIYLIIGGTISFALLVLNISAYSFLTTFFPVVFSFGILFLQIVSGVSYITKPSSVGSNWIFVSLVLMVFQFSFFGFHFANYFGPYLALGITDTPQLRIIFDHYVLGFRAANEYVK